MKLIIDIPDAAYQAIQDVKDIEVTQAEVSRNPLYYVLTQAVEKGEPLRTGHWTYICNSKVNGLKIVRCSACNKRTYGSTDFCPNCGAKMIEPQESEE